jgi:phage host-nuclease inhibitor protein Gam
VREEVVTHEDVTTMMALLGDIRDEARRIRWILEDDDGEQETETDDLDT